MPLLDPDEPPPFTLDNPQGRSPFVIACDHAGRRLPRRLVRLGLGDGDLVRHIAWDIGAGAVARRLGAALDAVVICQTYSRLVIDCNRPPSAPSLIPELSELTPIPGNVGLDAASREARHREIFAPYHDCIAAEIERRLAEQRPTLLIALHSFTPVFKGVARPWHVGVLYNRDARLGRALGRLLEGEPGLVVGDNEPYAITDGSDYTVPRHAEAHGLAYVEIEIRQDLIAEAAGEADWADRLARLLPRAAAGFV